MKQLLLISAILLCALAVLSCVIGMVSGWADKPIGGNGLENTLSVLKGLFRRMSVAIFCLSTALLAVLAARHMQAVSTLSSGKTTLCIVIGSVMVLIGFMGFAEQLFLMFGPNGFYTETTSKFQAVPWIAGAMNALVQTAAFGFILIAAPKFLRPKT